MSWASAGRQALWVATEPWSLLATASKEGWSGIAFLVTKLTQKRVADWQESRRLRVRTQAVWGGDSRQEAVTLEPVRLLRPHSHLSIFTGLGFRV